MTSMLTFECPSCETPGAIQAEDVQWQPCQVHSNHQHAYATCHECGECVIIWELESQMAERQIKRIGDNGVDWRPYCQTCIAELSPIGDKAVCVICQESWEMASLDAVIVELEERTPNPELVPTELRSEPEPETIQHWVTDAAELARVESMYQEWVDGYHGEPNADRNLAIEAATQFVAYLLAEEHVVAEQQGNSNSYAKWRNVAHSLFNQALAAKRATA